MMTSVQGNDDRRSRWTSLAVTTVLPEGEGNQESRARDELHTGDSLSGKALQYILTYLPDHFFAFIYRVCQAWNNAIKSSSPEFWQKILH